MFAHSFLGDDIRSSKRPVTKELEDIKEEIVNCLERIQIHGGKRGNTQDTSVSIECVPSSTGDMIDCVHFSMIVDPRGQYKINGTVEQVLDMSFARVGSLMPSHSLDNKIIGGICKKIARLCPKYSLIGNLSIEVNLWKDKDGTSQYAVRNLSTYISSSILRLQNIQICTGLRFIPDTNSLIFRKEDIPFNIERLRKAEFTSAKDARDRFLMRALGHIKEVEYRYVFYSECSMHSNAGVVTRETIKTINSGLHYDSWYRIGSLYPSCDTVSDETIPMSCIEHSLPDAINKFMRDLYRLNHNLRVKNVQSSSNFQKIASTIVSRCHRYGLVLEEQEAQPSMDPFSDFIHRYFETSEHSRPSSGSKGWEKYEGADSLSAIILGKRFPSHRANKLDAKFYSPRIDEAYERPAKRKYVTEETITVRADQIMKEIEAAIVNEEMIAAASGTEIDKVPEGLSMSQMLNKSSNDAILRTINRLSVLEERREILIQVRSLLIINRTWILLL